MDTSLVVITVLGGLVMVRWVVIGVGAALIVRTVTGCPACFAATVAVRRRWLRPLARWFEWRWCPSCGWEGVSRRHAGRRAAPRPPSSGTQASPIANPPPGHGR